MCACTHAISCLCVEWKSKRKAEEGGATGGRIDVRQRERGWERGKREQDSRDWNTSRKLKLEMRNNKREGSRIRRKRRLKTNGRKRNEFEHWSACACVCRGRYGKVGGRLRGYPPSQLVPLVPSPTQGTQVDSVLNFLIYLNHPELVINWTS